ncbi:urate oxidase [Paenibacillus yonginensis]|uniref:Uricase n=1 Tax=Paenibacillus yonginensis TaxID=1462996 RepID=A0A1B1MVW4_9BACL|nr:urate oxidase [Paenibacillus yonginensis]ANS73320.1 urate oxidase [Paenibacillus yonginensis]
MLKHSSGRTLYYGKGDVLVYRTYAKPLQVAAVPESAFEGDRNIIFAHNIKFAVSGDKLLASFTEGSNTFVVATDSMKNFLLRNAAEYEGGTTEGLLLFLGRRFLQRYPHITSAEISADRLPFQALDVPGSDGFVRNELVFRRSHNDHASAGLELVSRDGNVEVLASWSGLTGLQLIKVSGSSFYGFVRDEYTTLPDSYDRPLFIFLDIFWRYGDPEQAADAAKGKYVAAEQISDIAHTVFYEEQSPSIQHLIWLIGQRILIRFPQLAEVSFESNNRTWETIVDPASPGQPGVFTEPRPPYGFQGFTVIRADVQPEAPAAGGE